MNGDKVFRRLNSETKLGHGYGQLWLCRFDRGHTTYDLFHLGLQMGMAQTYPKASPPKMVPLLTVDSSTFSASGSSCSHLHGGQKCIFR